MFSELLKVIKVGQLAGLESKKRGYGIGRILVVIREIYSSQ